MWWGVDNIHWHLGGIKAHGPVLSQVSPLSPDGPGTGIRLDYCSLLFIRGRQVTLLSLNLVNFFTHGVVLYQKPAPALPWATAQVSYHVQWLWSAIVRVSRSRDTGEFISKIVKQGSSANFVHAAKMLGTWSAYIQIARKNVGCCWRNIVNT